MNKNKAKDLSNAEVDVNKIPAESKNKEIKTKKNRTLLIRTISSVGLLIVLFLYCSSGAFYVYWNQKHKYISETLGYFCMIFSMMIIGVSIWEMCKSYRIKSKSICWTFILMGWGLFLIPATSNLSAFLFFLDLNISGFNRYTFLISLFVVLLLTYLMLHIGEKKSFEDIILFYFIFIVITLAYKGFTITSLLLGVQNPEGGFDSAYSFNTNLWIWAIAIMSDTFAYFGGSFFGKHKMAPIISPKKTWEGAIIGYVLAVAGAMLYANLFFFLSLNHRNAPFRNLMLSIDSTKVIIVYLFLSLLFPFISVLGDLLFSYNKRKQNIKDYSNVIPGHGGVLDRLDSISLCLALMFVLIFVVDK